MQPYFFPYIGYWQLMALTDVYVIYDDVSFIKGGWINRNRILGPSGPTYINVPCKNAGSGIRICDVGADISPRYLRKAENKLTFAYRRAPYFDEVYPFIFDVISFKSDSLADYLANSIEKTASLLGIGTVFIRTSKTQMAPELRGQARVIEICRQLGAASYLNAIGGVKLYNCAEFEKAGLTLKFVKAGHHTEVRASRRYTIYTDFRQLKVSRSVLRRPLRQFRCSGSVLPQPFHHRCADEHRVGGNTGASDAYDRI